MKRTIIPNEILDAMLGIPPDPPPTKENDMPTYDDDERWERSEFMDPGGESALRAASPSNPRNLPCPTCKEPNKLTPKDKRRGYQCDACARRAEGGGY
ncbi:MAG: hypothetical protein V4537_14225 [Pseudomonadota bacterium]